MDTPMPCALRAVGLVTALGHGIDATWPRLIAGDATALTTRTDLVSGQSVLVGAVPDPLPAVPEPLRRHDCRNNALALAALRQVEGAVRAVVADVGPRRVAVVMGTSTSGLASTERAVASHLRTGTLPPEFDYVQFEHGGLAEFLAAYLGVQGPALVLSTACSSGAKALAAARALLALGVADAVLAGGADSLCGLTAHGFRALQAVSDARSTPFSANRKGLNLGEGAAVFLVLRAAGGIQLLGVGETSDAHHMSAPDPEGVGAETAMRAALEDAGRGPQDVAYLNLHGTGTPLNDAVESAAVHRVLGPAVPCSSTKPLVGHALGASGAIEAAFCWMMLAHAGAGELALPPHRWDGVPDPALPALRLVVDGERAPAGAGTLVLSNSFGFGGSNCTLVLAREVPCSG